MPHRSRYGRGRAKKRSYYTGRRPAGRKYKRSKANYPRRNARRTTGSGKPGKGIGDWRTIKTFKLCDIFTLKGDGANKTVDVTFPISDPTDPGGALGNAQPTGWEEVAAFYERAKVISCWQTYKFTNVSTEHGSLMVGLLPNTSAVTLSSTDTEWTTWCGYPRIQKRQMQTVDLDAGGGAESKSVYMRYGTKPAEHFAQNFRDNAFEIILPDTSPSDIVSMHMLLSKWDNTVPVTTHILQVTVVQNWKVLFYDRKNLALGTDT